jgi:Fe2+ transport system protein FeoA
MERPEDIVEILNHMDLEEALYELGITPEETLEILYRGGHVKIPDWVQDRVLKY